MFLPRSRVPGISLLVVSLMCLHASGGYAAVQATGQAQATAVYEQSAQDVANAVSSVLVERGELPAPMAAPMSLSAAEAVGRAEQGTFTSQSMSVAQPQLADLVAPEAQALVGDPGGRYVITVILEGAEDGGTRMIVHATLIATVPGAQGPLGGRLLPSNGTLENQVLQAVASSLGGG